MLITCFDSQRIIRKEFLPEGKTMNAARYIEIMTSFMKRLHRVRPQYAQQVEGKIFDDIPDIQRNVTRLLNSIPKENFLQSFKNTYSRSQRCIVMGGDYFEGQKFKQDGAMSTLQRFCFDMVSPQGQVLVVTWFIEFKSATHVQQEFWTTYKRSPPPKSGALNPVPAKLILCTRNCPLYTTILFELIGTNGKKDNLVALHFKYDQARRRFVKWAQNEIAVVPDFHKRILFSDEAHFWLNGYVNKRNCRIWSEANPQVYVETPLNTEKLTVWCALWAGGILLQNDEGHNVTVNGERYRAMITNLFIPELNNHDVQELWFQQDGATCHTARATIDLLKDTFGDRLISRFGPVNWPPRSCDLTPLDYFL
ncbi:DUF4817 domain-containing protein [Trichonephila clavipes]|nr:DUF4817 domain-containing protein [Trichonephila clavipes]